MTARSTLPALAVLLAGCHLEPMEAFQLLMLAIFGPLFLLTAASGSRR